MFCKSVCTALVAFFVLAACSRATADNYARLTAGMSHDQVYAILGKPDKIEGGGIGGFTVSAETWNGGEQTIQVTFTGDKLALKAIERAKP